MDLWHVFEGQKVPTSGGGMILERPLGSDALHRISRGMLKSLAADTKGRAGV